MVGELLLGYPGLGLFRVLVVHCCRSEQALAAISRAVAVTMLLLASFSRMAIVPALTDDLYHYTSSNIALDSIIAQMQLRLGLVELMNDPRESRPRYPNLSIAEGVPKAGPAIMEEADRLLRRAAKVACFTQDYELPDSVADRNALRGYAHPALWAHYAGGHTGVCLRFDRRALDSCMRAQLSSYGLLFEGAVEYRQELSSTAQATGLDVEQIHEFGLDAVVTRYIERYQRELFFEKHSDWASEAEYRWGVCKSRAVSRLSRRLGCHHGHCARRCVPGGAP